MVGWVALAAAGVDAAELVARGTAGVQVGLKVQQVKVAPGDEEAKEADLMEGDECGGMVGEDVLCPLVGRVVSEDMSASIEEAKEGRVGVVNGGAWAARAAWVALVFPGDSVAIL